MFSPNVKELSDFRLQWVNQFQFQFQYLMASLHNSFVVIAHDYHDHFTLFFSYLFLSFSLLTYLLTRPFVYFFLLNFLRTTNEQLSTMDSRHHLRHASTTGLGYRQSQSLPHRLFPSLLQSPHPTPEYLRPRDHKTSTRPHLHTEPYDVLPI